MIDALKDFITIIKDWLMSIIDGMLTLVESFTFINTAAQGASVWMPSFLFGILLLNVTVVIILRVVGR